MHRVIAALVTVSIAASLMLAATVLADERSPLSSTITYQGRLTQTTNGVPIGDAAYDLTFTLYADPTSGASVAGPIVRDDWPLYRGVFTVDLDFGFEAFPGAERWLEIAGRPASSSGEYTIFLPRQRVTATPYALWAMNGGSGGGIQAVQAGPGLTVTPDPNGPVVTVGVAPNGITSELLADHLALGASTSGTSGSLDLFNSQGNVVASLVGEDSASLVLRRASSGMPTVRLDADGAAFNADSAKLFMYDADGELRVRLYADSGSNAGGQFGLFSETTSAFEVVGMSAFNTGGYIWLNNPTVQEPTVAIRGNSGNGGSTLAMSNGQALNQETITLNANGQYQSGELRLSHGSTAATLTYMFATSIGGYVQLFRPNGTTGIYLQADGSAGPAELDVCKANGHSGVFISGGRQSGTNCGEVWLFNDSDTPLIRLTADDPDVPGNDDAIVRVCGKVKARVFEPGGCDVAEAFEHSASAIPNPGMVMVIDAANPGMLTVSTQAYDKKVAGIISGAGGLRPGMVLGGETGAVSEAEDADQAADEEHCSQSSGTPDELPLALAGRVYCYVDATEYAVEVGDLLTTSATPGHAMKAADPTRAFGAVLGKAMEPLAKGEKGLVLVLVALQ